MNHHQTERNISISKDTYELIQQTKQGTNLSDSDVLELIIKQYFRFVKPASTTTRAA